MSRATHLRDAALEAQTHAADPRLAYMTIDRQKFWSHVDKSAGPEACWPWLGTTNAENRGRYQVAGRPAFAYRCAWELTHDQPFPEGLIACHECDNPNCCNPSHITPGTHAYNSQGAKERNRLRVGVEHHYGSVAPDVIASSVAEYLRGGASQAEMARRLGVAQVTFGMWVRAEVRADAGLKPTRLGKGNLPGVPPKPHGTHAAYARHLRAGEKPCQLCREGESKYGAEQRARRKVREMRAADESEQVAS